MTEQNKNTELTLTLDLNSVNNIIAALDEIPHKYSRPIIDNITQQAQIQLREQNVPEGPLSNKVVS
jgi:pyruvate/oxaloacetate carboxyltransferase